MDKNSLTFLVFKNTLYNIIGYIWPLFFTLIITPIIVFKLGIKEYGIYIFVNAALTLFGLLDLGLGTAVTKHMSYYYGKKDSSAIVRLTRSANSLFLIIGTLGFLLILLVTFVGPELLPVRFAAYKTYSVLFAIGGLTFFWSSVISTYNAILVAVQRFDIRTKIGMSQISFSSLGILAIVESGGGLISIFLFQLFVTIILAFITYYHAQRSLPESRLEFGWDKAEIKNCYTFGVVNFVNNIASTALSSLDRLIIPFYAGPSNLTYYSIAGNVGSKIPGMANTLSISLFPTVSQLSGGEDTVRINSLYVRSFRLITIIAGALTITSMAFAYKILFYWLNPEFADKASMILIILALTNFLLALFGPLSNFLLGLGKLKFLSISSIGMAILNAGLLLILLPRYGILGAAYAYLISVLPVLYFFYYVEKHYLELPERKAHYLNTILGTLITSILVWGADLLLGRLIVDLITLLIIGGVSAILYVLLFKLLGFFEEEDWLDLERFYVIFLNKFKQLRHGKENS